MATVNETRWLSPAEVARLLGQSRQSIYRKLQNGTLPTPVRLVDGGPLRVNEDELHDWLEQRRATAPPGQAA